MEMINVNSNVRKIFEMSGIPKIIQINWCRGGFAWEFCGTKFAHCKSTHALKWKEKIKMENKVKLELMSKSSNEAVARIAIAAFVSQLDPTIEEIADIKTAVSEAVTNCIIHGYEEKEGLIYITCVLNNREVTIEIKDNGIGIENIDMAKEPLYTSKPELERSGMGFTIMESFMDEMKIQSIIGLGTKVIMKKVIKKSDLEDYISENWRYKKGSNAVMK